MVFKAIAAVFVIAVNSGGTAESVRERAEVVPGYSYATLQECREALPGHPAIGAIGSKVEKFVDEVLKENPGFLIRRQGGNLHCGKSASVDE